MRSVVLNLLYMRSELNGYTGFDVGHFVCVLMGIVDCMVCILMFVIYLLKNISDYKNIKMRTPSY